MPHVLPGIAVFFGCGMEPGLRHDQEEREADQEDAHCAHLDGQRRIFSADQGCGAHADQRSKQSHLRGTQEQLVGGCLPDLVRDPGLGGAGGEGIAQPPDDLRQQDGQKGRKESFDEKAPNTSRKSI